MKQLFLGATKDEELYPPRCCGNVVPPGLALRLLSYKELRDFSESALEWTAKDRLYCAEPTCSKLSPHLLFGMSLALAHVVTARRMYIAGHLHILVLTARWMMHFMMFCRLPILRIGSVASTVVPW